MLQAESIEKTWSQILKVAPQEAILRRIKIRPGLLDILVTLIFKSVLVFLFRIFWQLKIKGREFLPSGGPYLICPNHASYLDGFAVFSSLTFRSAINTFFLGYSDIFEHPSVSWGNKLARLIPIDPNTHLTEAMQAVSFVLSEKKIACIFPEGRRSIDENIAEFKKGVGILIKELGVPVIPVYIQGSHQSWPRGNLLPRLYPLKVTFGKPILAAELLRNKEQGQSLDDYEAIAQALREEVLKLVC
jgi:long-chain acyl-CoA synthetase